MKELALHQFSIVRMFQILFRECLTLGSDLKFHAVLITSDRSIPRGWWQRNGANLCTATAGSLKRFVVSHLWGSFLQRYQSCALAIPVEDIITILKIEQSKKGARCGPVMALSLLFCIAYSSLYDTQDVHANLLLIPRSERGQPTIWLKLDL